MTAPEALVVWMPLVGSSVALSETAATLTRPARVRSSTTVKATVRACPVVAA